TAVTPTRTLSTAVISMLHHWCFRHIALFSSPHGFCLGPALGEPEAADSLSALARRHQDADVIDLTWGAVNYLPRHDVRMGYGVRDGCWCTTGGERRQSAAGAFAIMKFHSFVISK